MVSQRSSLRRQLFAGEGHSFPLAHYICTSWIVGENKQTNKQKHHCLQIFTLSWKVKKKKEVGGGTESQSTPKSSKVARSPWQQVPRSSLHGFWKRTSWGRHNEAPLSHTITKVMDKGDITQAHINSPRKQQSERTRACAVPGPAMTGKRSPHLGAVLEFHMNKAHTCSFKPLTAVVSKDDHWWPHKVLPSSLLLTMVLGSTVIDDAINRPFLG